MLDRGTSESDKKEHIAPETAETAETAEDTYEALREASSRREGGIFGRVNKAFNDALQTGRGPARTRSAAEEGGDDPDVTADDLAIRRARHVKPVAMMVPEGAIIEGSITCGSETEIGGRIEGDVTVDGRLHLGPSALVTGNVRATSCRLEGLVEGQVDCSDLLELGQEGRLKADAIAGKEMVLKGKVFGDVTTGGTLRLLACASLSGTIRARRFVMEEGATFNGTCVMRPPAQREGAAPADK